MNSWKLIITGHVQQVGYRFYTSKQIKELFRNIKGYIKNRNNGSVEVLVYEDDGFRAQSLDEVVRICQTGSPLSRVDNIEIEHFQSDVFSYNNLEGFIILQS